MFTDETKEIFTNQFAEFMAWAKVNNEYSPARLRVLLTHVKDHHREIFEQCINFLDAPKERLVEMFGYNEAALRYFESKKLEWISNIPISYNIYTQPSRIQPNQRVQHNAPLYKMSFSTTTTQNAIPTVNFFSTAVTEKPFTLQNSKPVDLSSSLEDLFNLAD